MKAFSPQNLGLLTKRQLKTLLTRAHDARRKAALDAIKWERIEQDIFFELKARGGK